MVASILFLWPSAGQASSKAEWNQLVQQATMLMGQSKPKEAIPFALEAVKQAEEAFGPESQNVMVSLGLLSSIYQSAGEHEKAKVIQDQISGKASVNQLHEQAAKAYKDRMANHAKAVMDKMAEKLANQRRQGESQQGASAILEQKVPEASLPHTGSQDQVRKKALGREVEWSLLMQQATMLSFQGKPKEAIPLATEAVKKAEEVFGPGSQNAQASRSLLVTLRQSLGEREIAPATSGQVVAPSDNQSQQGTIQRDLAGSLAQSPSVSGSARADMQGAKNEGLSVLQGQKQPAEIASKGEPQELMIEQARAMGMGDLADAMQKMRETQEKRRASKGTASRHNEVLGDVKILSEVESQDPELIALLKPFQEGMKRKAAELGKTAGVAVERAGILTDADLTLSYLGSQGEYLKALPIAERAVKLAEDRLATGSTITMMRRHNLAQLYLRLERYEKAEPLFLELKTAAERDSEERRQKQVDDLKSMKDSDAAMKQGAEVMKKRTPAGAAYFEGLASQHEALTKRVEAMTNLGAERSHGPQADYENSLAEIYRKLGRFNEAEQYKQRAVELSAQGYAPRKSEIVMDQILQFMEIGNYAKAQSLSSQHETDLARWEGSDASQAILLDKKAQVLIALGRFQEAEQLLTKALKMWTDTIHDGQEVYFMNRLAKVYRSVGKYTEASRLYADSLRLSQEKDKMKSIHADGVSVLTDLAQLQQELGQYTAATLSANRAMEIQTGSLGSTHPETAATVMILGRLYQDQDEYDKAKEHLDKAKAIFEDRLGKSHLRTATCLMSLAGLHHRWAKYEQAKSDPKPEVTEFHFESAKSHYERALQIRKDKLLPEHLDIASSLTELARLYQDMRNHEKAENLHQQALQIYQKVLGPEHQDTGASIKNLADVSLDQKNYKESEQRYRQALSVFEKAVGKNHPATANALVGLGRLRALQNRPKDALDFLRQAVAIEAPVLLAQLGTARENRKLQLLERASYTRNFVIGLVEKYFKDDKAATQFALELVLSRKALVFDDQAQVEKVTAAGLDPSLRSKRMDLKQQIATLELHPPAQISPGALRKKHQAIVAELERVEAHMASKSPGFIAHSAQQRATVEELAKVMPPQSVLVEYLRIPAIDWSTLRTSNSYWYVAFVLRPDRAVTMLSLGDARTLEEGLIQRFKNSVKKGTALSASFGKAKELYEALWQPVVEAVGSPKTIIVSPDGELNHVPFAALLSPDGKFLIERSVLTYVTSGRDLLKRVVKSAAETDLVLVANPDFGDSATRSDSPRSEMNVEPVRSRESAGTFVPLPGTKREAENIPLLVPGQAVRKRIYTQQEAQEKVILAANHPRILHLATHGYFLPNEESRLPMGQPQGTRPFSAGGRSQTENALLRSGIALAGANQASSTLSSMDGLLTAYEVSGMDLQGTDLVTLSACQTGVGEVRNGDGVYGLRRSFALAGARHLLMSLWKVDDELTALQMESFYAGYGKEGKSPAEALHIAQVAMIAKLKKETGVASPMLWAPFIVQGSPGELKALQ